MHARMHASMHAMQLNIFISTSHLVIMPPQRADDLLELITDVQPATSSEGQHHGD
jgi:hypothetical protein